MTETVRLNQSSATAPPAGHRGRKRAKIENRWYVRMMGLALLVGVLAAWQAIVVLADIPAVVLPRPTDVLPALWTGLSSGLYWEHFLATVGSLVGGFLLATAAGLVLGTLLVYSRWAQRLVYPYIITFQSFPKIAIAPLLVLWLGYGPTSQVAVAAITAFMPIMSNVEAGLRSADPDHLDLMDSVGATRWEGFVHVRLPASLPYVFSGLQVGLIFSMLGAIVAEFVGARSGLGVLIMNLNYNLDVAGVFSVLIILAVMGVSLYLGVRALRSKLVFWEGRREEPTDV